MAEAQEDAPLRMKTEPEPPSGQPHGPGVRAPHKAPQPPGKPMGEPDRRRASRITGAEAFAPLGKNRNRRVTVGDHGISQTSAAVAERPPVLPAQCVVLDEFLAPQELEELTRFTLEHEADFSTSDSGFSDAESGVVNYDHRRSRVLMDLAQHRGRDAGPHQVRVAASADELGMEEFAIAGWRPRSPPATMETSSTSTATTAAIAWLRAI